jgi:hypothetical protein
MKRICPSQMREERFWQPLAAGFTALKIFLEVPEVEQSEFFKIFHRMCCQVLAVAVLKEFFSYR